MPHSWGRIGAPDPQSFCKFLHTHTKLVPRTDWKSFAGPPMAMNLLRAFMKLVERDSTTSICTALHTRQVNITAQRLFSSTPLLVWRTQMFQGQTHPHQHVWKVDLGWDNHLGFLAFFVVLLFLLGYDRLCICEGYMTLTFFLLGSAVRQIWWLLLYVSTLVCRFVVMWCFFGITIGCLCSRGISAEDMLPPILSKPSLSKITLRFFRRQCFETFFPFVRLDFHFKSFSLNSYLCLCEFICFLFICFRGFWDGPSL